MKLIYVAGPYRAKTVADITRNIRRAESVAMQVWALGYPAICPHINSAHFDGVACDKVFLAGMIELLDRCDAMILVDGWERSVGTLAEIEHAKERGIPVFRSLGELYYWLPISVPETSINDVVPAQHVACNCATCA